MIGETVSHYRVLERLGAGGMGEVFRAEDVKLGRPVALKFLPTDLVGDEAAVKRFLWEARSLSALNHPNICTIYEVDEYQGRPFIAMELLEGQPLHHYVGGKPLRSATLVDLAAQIADGLDAAHVQGLLHRDIKPANIFVTPRGQAKILDFGLAKLAHQAQSRDAVLGSGAHAPRELTTTPGITMGTIAYMSPEQARGEALDARSDLFSLGLVLYEMATGRQTFSGNTTAVIFDSILNRDPVPPGELNPDLPIELDRIISKAIEKDCRFRYQSASDLRADLGRLKRALDSGKDVTTSGALKAYKSGGVPAVAPVAAPVAPDDTRGRARADSRRKTAPTAVPVAAPVRPAARPQRTGGRAKTALWMAFGLIAVAAGASGAYLVWQDWASRQATSETTPAEPVAGAAPAAAPLEVPSVQAPAASGGRTSNWTGGCREGTRRGPAEASAAGGRIRGRRDGSCSRRPGDAGPPTLRPCRRRAPRKARLVAAEAEASSALADARAKVNAKEYDQALSALTTILKQHSDSSVVPEALLLAARVHEAQGTTAVSHCHLRRVPAALRGARARGRRDTRASLA